MDLEPWNKPEKRGNRHAPEPWNTRKRKKERAKSPHSEPPPAPQPDTSSPDQGEPAGQKPADPMDEVVRGLGMDAAELKRLARPRPVPQTRVTQYRDRRAEAVQQVVDVRAALTKSELLWVILIVWFIGPFCGFGLIAGIAMIVVGTSELSRVNELMATGQPVEAQIISAFPEDSSDEGGTSTHYKVEVRFPPHVKGGASDTKVVRRATFDRFREASETKPMAAALLVAPGPDGDWIVEQDVGSVRRDAWVFLGIGSALLSGTTVVPIAAILVYIRRRRRKLAKPTRNYATESDPEESETRARLDEYR